MDYVTASESSLTRTLQLSRVILISLPLAVNVENFFRGTRYVVYGAAIFAHLCFLCSLFVRFTLSTTTHQYIRIKSADLSSDNDGDAGLKIARSMLQSPRIVVSNDSLGFPPLHPLIYDF